VKLTVLTGITALVVLVFIFELVRRRQLREKYAGLWLGIGLVVAVLGFFPRLLDNISRAVGVVNGVSLVLFLGIVFLLLVCLHLSWEMSRMEEETRSLAEEVALLRTQVTSALRRATGENDPFDPSLPDPGGAGLGAAERFDATLAPASTPAHQRTSDDQR
jgi:hypothetical protein